MKRNQKYLMDEYYNVFRITKNNEQVLCSPKNKNLGIHLIKISYLKARTLLNEQWLEVEHEWEYNGDIYKTFKNSEGYTLDKHLPNFRIQGKYHEYMLCEYHGRIYKATMYSGYFPQIQLYPLNSEDPIFWTNAKNCKCIYKLNKEINNFELM